MEGSGETTVRGTEILWKEGKVSCSALSAGWLQCSVRLVRTLLSAILWNLITVGRGVWRSSLASSAGSQLIVGWRSLGRS